MKPNAKETLITVWNKRLVCHVYGAQRAARRMIPHWRIP
jgi:hypothetical protein